MIFQTMSCSVSLGEIGVGLAGSSNFAGQWRGTSEKSPCTRFPIKRPGGIFGHVEGREGKYAVVKLLQGVVVNCS